MKNALLIINEKLLATGMTQDEIDELMGRFLEEEAFDYVATTARTLKKFFKEDDNTPKE